MTNSKPVFVKLRKKDIRGNYKLLVDVRKFTKEFIKKYPKLLKRLSHE